MVIVMEHAASEEQVQKVIETLGDEGYDVHRSSGTDYTVLGAVGAPPRPIDPRLVEETEVTGVLFQNQWSPSLSGASCSD